MQLLLPAATGREIAATLHLTEGTVKNRMSAVLENLASETALVQRFAVSSSDTAPPRRPQEWRHVKGTRTLTLSLRRSREAQASGLVNVISIAWCAFDRSQRAARGHRGRTSNWTFHSTRHWTLETEPPVSAGINTGLEPASEVGLVGAFICARALFDRTEGQTLHQLVLCCEAGDDHWQRDDCGRRAYLGQE